MYLILYFIINLNNFNLSLTMEFILYLIIGLIIGFLFGKFWIESQLKLKYQKQLRQIENDWNEEKLNYVQTRTELNTEKQLNKLVNDQLKDTFEALAANF